MQAANKIMAKEIKPESATYQFRIEGVLPDTWAEWFDGFDINHEQGKETVISGEVIDQTQLHSLLERIRDLGLTLLEVKKMEEY